MILFIRRAVKHNLFKELEFCPRTRPHVVSTSRCGVGVFSSFQLFQYWSNVITCKKLIKYNKKQCMTSYK